RLPLRAREVIGARGRRGARPARTRCRPWRGGVSAAFKKLGAGLPEPPPSPPPPLHEFLPKSEAEFAEMVKATGKDMATVRHRAAVLHEMNPMLGHRGCRLGISYPEIYEMQARAIFEAA